MCQGSCFVMVKMTCTTCILDSNRFSDIHGVIKIGGLSFCQLPYKVIHM